MKRCQLDAPPLAPVALFSLCHHVKSPSTFVAAKCQYFPFGEGELLADPNQGAGLALPVTPGRDPQ